MCKMKRTVLAAIAMLITTLATAQTTTEHMSLGECIARAMEYNYSLKSSKLQTRQAANNVTPSPFTPTVSGTARQNQSAMNSGVTNNIGAGLSLEWRIFDGGGMFATYARQKSLLSVAELQQHSFFETLLANVTNQYYALVSLRNRTNIARESMQLSELRYREALAKYTIGAASGLEMKLAKTDLNADSSSLIKQEEALRVAYITMNQLINAPLDNNAYVRDTIIMSEQLERESLVDRTLKQNTDILLARVGVRLSEQELTMARASRWPTIDFAAGYNYNVTDANNFTGTFANSNGANWGFNLGVNIFNGLEASRKVRNAKLGQSIKDLNLKDIELSVMSEFEQLYLNYVNNLQLIDFENENSEAARLNLNVAMDRYRLGDLSGIDFRNIQQQYLSAVDRKLNVIYQAKASEVALLSLAGEIYFRTIR